MSRRNDWATVSLAGGKVLLLAPRWAVEDPVALQRYLAQPYIRRLHALGAAVEQRPGELLQADVHHEAWCPVLANAGLCVCEADVALRVVRGGNGGR